MFIVYPKCIKKIPGLSKVYGEVIWLIQSVWRSFLVYPKCMEKFSGLSKVYREYSSTAVYQGPRCGVQVCIKSHQQRECVRSKGWSVPAHES